MTSTEGPIVERALEPMHCRECQRLLLKIQHRGLRPSYVLEVRCRCHTMNFLIGTPST